MLFCQASWTWCFPTRHATPFPLVSPFLSHPHHARTRISWLSFELFYELTEDKQAAVYCTRRRSIAFAWDILPGRFIYSTCAARRIRYRLHRTMKLRLNRIAGIRDATNARTVIPLTSSYRDGDASRYTNKSGWSILPIAIGLLYRCKERLSKQVAASVSVSYTISNGLDVGLCSITTFPFSCLSTSITIQIMKRLQNEWCAQICTRLHGKYERACFPSFQRASSLLLIWSIGVNSRHE